MGAALSILGGSLEADPESRSLVQVAHLGDVPRDTRRSRERSEGSTNERVALRLEPGLTKG